MTHAPSSYGEETKLWNLGMETHKVRLYPLHGSGSIWVESWKVQASTLM
jgi:hypothetical protein